MTDTSTESYYGSFPDERSLKELVHYDLGQAIPRARKDIGELQQKTNSTATLDELKDDSETLKWIAKAFLDMIDV